MSIQKSNLKLIFLNVKKLKLGSWYFVHNNFLWVCWCLAKNFVILFESWQPISTYFQVHFQQKQYLWRSLDLWFYWFSRISWWVFGSFHRILFLWLCYANTRCSIWQSCIHFLTQLDRILLIIAVWGTIAIRSMANIQVLLESRKNIW